MDEQQEDNQETMPDFKLGFKWLPILKDLELLERLGVFHDAELHNTRQDQQYITSNNTVEKTHRT